MKLCISAFLAASMGTREVFAGTNSSSFVGTPPHLRGSGGNASALNRALADADAAVAAKPVQLTLGPSGGVLVKPSLDADGINRGSSVVNNIGYILKGYDLLKGNPLDAVGLVKVDEGFRSAIFAPEEFEATADRQFYSPKGVNVVECEGCNLDFSSYTVDSTQAYVSSLAAKASLGVTAKGAGLKGAFSLSAGYAQAEERLSEKNELSTASEASCCVYQAEMALYELPPFSDGFTTALERLTANPGEEETATFIEEFGTHYVKKAAMGSLFGEISYFTAEKWSEMKSMDFNIEVAASASGQYASGEIKGELEYAKQNRETFQQSAEKRSVYARGATPPADGDVQKWLDESAKNPVPTYIELKPIYDLIEDRNAKDRVKTYNANYCATVNPFAAKLCTPSENSATKSVIKQSREEHENKSKQLKTTTTTTQFEPQLKEVVSDLKEDGSHSDGTRWQVAGLEGPKVLVGFERTENTRKWRRYEPKFKAYLDSFLSNDIEEKEQTGWKTSQHLYSDDVYNPSPSSYTCPNGMAMIEVMHRFDDWKVDRYWSRIDGGTMGVGAHKFKYWCGSYAGIKIDTDKQKKLDDVKCPRQQVLIGFYSQASGRKTGSDYKKTSYYRLDSETRQIICAPVGPKVELTEEKRWITPFLHNPPSELNVFYQAPAKSVMVGIKGDLLSGLDYVDYGKDSHLRAIEGGLSRNYAGLEKIETKGCEATAVCPNGKALVGFESDFWRSTRCRHLWGAYCASVPGHNLHLGNGDIFRDGVPPEETDWSHGLQGNGGSFALECPTGMVMAGYQANYDPKNRDEFGGWKILCLELKRV